MASTQDLHKGLSDSDAAASSQDFLATLHILVLRLQNFHNLQPHSQKRDADLRLEVHHCLLHIAHCAAPVGHVRVADAARFISEIPSQGACWHGAQPLLHVLVAVCTSCTEALCSLGKSALGAFLPASASRGVSSSAGDSASEPGGAGCCLSDQRAAREWEQQQLHARAVVEAMGAALVLLARMRPSLPAPRCAKLHSFLDALASTLLPLVASVQAIRPFTSPGAHSDEETSELSAHPGLKTSAPSPTGLSATQPPESQSADSIPSTASMAPPAGSAQPRASAAAQHHFALLGVVQSTCQALCEAAEDASVGAAVSAGLQPHEVLRALLLQLRGIAAGNRGIATRIWGCLDALMSLARKAAPHSRQSSLPAISFGDEPLPGKPPAGQPTFKLRQDVLPQLVLAALEELERGNNGDVLAVLRCFRRAWAQLLEDLGDAQMQEGVTIALVSHPGVEQPSLLDVAWRAVRAVCAAMKASKKKHPALAAAFISALLPPQLIPSPSKHAGTSASGRGHPDAYESQLTDTDAQSPRAACRDSVDFGGLGCLHDAKGPVPWAINCILEWGFSSPSVMLLLSCHLASLIIRRPQLLKIYAPQLQQILMQSADGMDCGSLMRRTLSTPSTEIERELGTVLPSADQAWLFDSLKRLVWHPSHGGSPEGQAQTSHSSSLAVHHARNPGNPTEPASPRKRPVIIFEEGGGWEDVRQPPGPGSATKSTHGTIPAAADVGSSVYDAYAESGSSNGGLKKGIGSAGRLPLSQASCSSQEGAPYSSSNSSGAHSSSSYSLRQGLSMLGRLTGESKPGPGHEGTNSHPGSGGRAAGGLDHGKHGMKSAIGPSGSHVHRSVSEGGWALWRAMLHVASSRTDICTDKVKRDSDTHRLKVRVWQALAVLTSFVQPPHVEASLRSVIALMSSNDAPSVKQYQEATAAALLVKEVHVSIPLLFAGDRTYIQRLFQFLEDNLEFQRLCRNVGLPSMDWNPEGLASPRRLLCGDTALIQQTAETLSFEGAPTTLLDRLIGFLQEEHIRLRKEMDKRAADTEELERQARQRGAPSSGYNSRDHAHGLDFQRKVTTSEQTAAVAGSRQGFWGSGFRHEGSGTGGLYEGLFECGLGDLLVLSESSPSAKGDGDDSVEGQGGEHQGTFRSRADGREQRVGMEAGARASGGGSCSRRQELIVVASLLDKAENLAGLSRTCEVFRAGLLVVPDLKVVSDPLFQTISVTAEKWIPIVEVREGALLEWLQDRKAEGFTCVGLEQTVESCKLPSYSFPNRCVLVLGKEKEGLPPEVIQMLDDSVEIPQLGLIRSLNVHVSGAIAMYEYTRQRACLDHC
ncbi:hypothetical protein DUNSADRAFT_2721 [Dunaliella salina]|nr:hypothetical protein DUNSADRAFT_2721 [Dunaliella salina]|eukprot:KAF5838523.1 hypothetical protein DUNSADRAFT_2721 [Dunaliella salina]